MGLCGVEEEMEVDMIYNEDCLKGMERLLDKSVDAVVTDPPFGIGFYYGKKEKINNPQAHWRFLSPIYDEIYRLLKPGGFLAIWQTALYFPYFWKWFGNDIHIYAGCKNFVQLRKTSINYGFDPIIMKYKEGAIPLRPEKPKRNIDFFVANTTRWTESIVRQHPCPRPIDQVEELIKNFTIENAIVLDPFIGSGTTAIACKKLNRQYIGFEINKEYYEVANKRLDNLQLEIIK